MKLFDRLRSRFGSVDDPSLGRIAGKLGSYLRHRNGFFIEAGANDGYAQSNTFVLERSRGWRGVLVEGIPELYERCRALRTRSTVFHCALVAHDYPHEVINMKFANLMSVTEGAMSEAAAEEHVRRGLEVQGLEESYAVQVPARTLDAVLDSQPNLPRIDLLSLDVEGYELNVLRGLSLDRYRPRYILVEARFFDEVNEHLLMHDYQLIDQFSHHDFLYHG